MNLDGRYLFALNKTDFTVVAARRLSPMRWICRLRRRPVGGRLTAWRTNGIPGRRLEDKGYVTHNMVVQYDNLGRLYTRRGDLGGAEEMYRKALALFEALGRTERAKDSGSFRHSFPPMKWLCFVNLRTAPCGVSENTCLPAAIRRASLSCGG